MRIRLVTKATRKSKKERTAGKARDGRSIGSMRDPKPSPEQAEMVYEIGDIRACFIRQDRQKVRQPAPFGRLANDIAKIANTHIDRTSRRFWKMTAILEK